MKTKLKKCPYCGQYSQVMAPCNYCGGPIVPDLEYFIKEGDTSFIGNTPWETSFLPERIVSKHQLPEPLPLNHLSYNNSQVNNFDWAFPLCCFIVIVITIYIHLLIT